MAERFSTQVLNYGGGSQTVTMLVLVAEGVLPRPDRIICADTSREVKSTWRYLDDHMRPYLDRNGIKAVEIAPHDLATVDCYSHQGTLLLPVFTATGKMSSWCSGEWKRSVVRRYLRSTGVVSATSWIGYAYDEMRRWNNATIEEGPWRVKFPLVDLHVTKADCDIIIRKAGLPPVSKSRCYMCPNQPNAEWRELRDKSPAEFELACQMDENIREDDDQHSVYLHASRVPLREADIEAVDRKEPSRQCTIGMCFI